MVSPRQLILEAATSWRCTSRRVERSLLFPKQELKQPLSQDLKQILRDSTLKSNYNSTWSRPLIDPANEIFDEHTLRKIIPKLTKPIVIDNSNSITKFLQSRILFTTESTFSNRVNSPHLGKDAMPITSRAIYLSLFDYFSRATSKSTPLDHKNVYQIFHKMEVNNVKPDIQMINQLISNHIGASNILSRYKLEENDQSYYNSLYIYFQLIDHYGLKPDMTTFYLTYLSFPIRSWERETMQKYITQNEHMVSSDQWVEIAFIEAIQCYLNNAHELSKRVLKTIVDDIPDKLTPKFFRSFYLKNYKTSQMLTSLISIQTKTSHNEYLRAIRIVNGIIQCTHTNKGTPLRRYSKYKRYQVHKRLRPSLTGSIGTIIIQHANNTNSWETLVKLLNWSLDLEKKVNFSSIKSVIEKIITLNNSQMDPIMKLVLVKYILHIAIPHDNSITVVRRLDHLYWKLQNFIDYSFNKHVELWGNSRNLRNLRTKHGFQRWKQNDLRFCNPSTLTMFNYNTPLSFNSQMLFSIIPEKNSSLIQQQQKEDEENVESDSLLEIVNSLDLEENMSHFNKLMNLDISILTPFETYLIDNVRKLELFTGDDKDILTVSTEPSPQIDEVGSEDTLLAPTDTSASEKGVKDYNEEFYQLKYKLEHEIASFENNYWFQMLLNETYCSWLSDELARKR